MKSMPRFLQFEGYETVDCQTSVRDQVVYIKLKAREDKDFCCHRCGGSLEGDHGSHALELKDLPLRGFKTLVRVRRRKGFCGLCGKVRSEKISFISKESPHFTQDYAWWIGTMCEFAPVSRVSELVDDGNMTVRRIDLKRMQRMLKHYRIPELTHIAVDEVYARKKKRHADEDRDRRFFTIITDLKTHKVVWVAESRKKQALDQFFRLIGPQACAKIQVVATDQHDAYAASVREHCSNASVVWDKFHIMQVFEERVNDVRTRLHRWLPEGDPAVRLSQGRYRFSFLKKASKRDAKERRHIEEVVKSNEDFAALEIIKERMLSFFDASTAQDAWEILMQVGKWISEKVHAKALEKKVISLAFEPLNSWWEDIVKGWSTLKNYFTYPVTSAVAEGINNVIKSLKRRAFGYRNMDYFRLKIMQVCGYLNSRHVQFSEMLGT